MERKQRQIVLVAHNIRSAHNVGSLLRTAEGLGVHRVYLTGYTPYPETKNDSRLPHQRQKQSRQIHKTALGAEDIIDWCHVPDINKCFERLRAGGYQLLALEQTAGAAQLNDAKAGKRLALFVGNEVSGLEPDILRKIKNHIQIPMSGRKESFNVVVAAAIALYHLEQVDKNDA